MVKLHTRGRREGEMKFLGGSILTERIGSRFKLIKKSRKLESTYGLFYCSTEPTNLGKVSRYSTTKLFLFNEKEEKLFSVKFDFSQFEDPMVQIHFVKVHKIDDGQFPVFLVYIRGFSKSQTYKVNRY